MLNLQRLFHGLILFFLFFGIPLVISRRYKNMRNIIISRLHRKHICNTIFTTAGTLSRWLTVYAVIPSKVISSIPITRSHANTGSFFYFICISFPYINKSHIKYNQQTSQLQLIVLHNFPSFVRTSIF